MDPLRALFQEEALQHLDALDHALMAVESGDTDADLDEVFRHLHTLKGLCRLNGLETAATLIHQVETHFTEHRDAAVAGTLLDWLPSLREAILAWCAGQPEHIAPLPDSFHAPDQSPDTTLPELPDFSTELKGLMTGPHKQALRRYLNDPELKLWELIYRGPGDALEEVLDRLEPLGDVYEHLVLYKHDPPHLEVLLLTEKDRDPLDIELPAGAEQLTGRCCWPLAHTDVPKSPAPSDTALPGPQASDAPETGAREDKKTDLQKKLAALKLAFARDKALELEETANQIIALGDTPDREQLDDVFRQFHSLKGAGGTHGLKDVTTVSHAAESLLAHARDHSADLNDAHVDVLLKATDWLRTRLRAEVEGTEIPTVPGDLIEALNAARQEEQREASPASTPPQAPEPAAPSAPATAEQAESNSPEGASPRTPVQPVNTTTTAAASAPLRVSLERVDTLINLSGEVSLALHGQARNLHDWRQAQRALDHASQLWRRLDSGTLPDDERYTLAQRLGTLLHKTGEHLRGLTSRFEGSLDQGMQFADQLISEALSLRSISVEQLFSQLPRLVRDTARQTGKAVRLVTETNDAEIDKHVLERLREPLIHMVRNAIDHGIEPPDQRKRAGKPETATLTVSARSQGSRITLRIEDDGRGLDAGHLRERAVSKGLLTEEAAAQLSDAEARRLIFTPGFSTRDTASEVSGRGVGMDVVRHAVESLGGQIRIHTQPGQGTTFELILPVNLSIIPVITLRVGTLTCAVQKDRIDRLYKPTPDALGTLNDRPALIRDDELIPLYPLASLMGLGEAGAAPFVLGLTTPEGPVGLQATEVLSEEWVMIRPFQGVIDHLPGYAGGFIDPEGHVVPVLDLNTLIQSTQSQALASAQIRQHDTRPPTILVAEDSLMTRQLYCSVLEGAGFTVIPTEDGLQAWEVLREREVDLVVSDIRMPELDGLELTRLIRRDSRLSHLPVILVTGQESDEEREAGMEAGADAYIFKSQFLQTELLERIRLLTGASA
ncbi:MAG: hybrid sensor histidine kinase/response regulator [Gammaproteobacteria bacterium]|nr:MAG: hybrid sensor histidine kinase/response regulator [Gammaproteobacteria bacterium]